ncbi:AraC family transcriptional regulator [Algibacter marinivivus]|uniref:AraC family transcriptional regulator n=1 Tax=Algibacter marinivivus TaxID=2100723 RepID=A0A2U2X900_9FLAO|nr:helix-turn-helix transcriptional regulator [Algibacter marinivivus]PWH84268.1 AraC family transcriptional regulator [Algibacter marinivivus]
MSITFRILYLVYLFAIPIGVNAIEIPMQSIQIDSLIKEKNINSDMTQLELLILYSDALEGKPKDSIQIFKHLAILNADLDQPKDAYVFTEKYISNTLDISILDNGAYSFIEYSDEYKKLENKYLPKIDTLSFLYFYVALIGFFFTIILNFTKNGNRKAKIFIGCFIGAHSLFILDFVIFSSNFQFRFPHAYRMSSSIALLLGPLLYFYFKSVTQNFKFKKNDLVHFIPTLVLILSLIPVYNQTALDKIGLMLQSTNTQKSYDYIIFVLKTISLVFYAFCIWKLQFSDKTIKSINHNSIFSWSKSLFRIHIAYVISYLLYGISAYVVFSSFSSFIYHFQIGAMSIMVIYIAYMAYVQPNIFNNESLSLKERLFSEKYKKSGLTEALSKELKGNLIKLLVEDKVYKQSDINLETLSEKLNTTRHNTSQIINEHFNMNFFELINKFRIKEAKRLLEDDAHGNLNIIDVAYEVGYNNKVTFNKAFKKETSQTPSSFIHAKIKSNSLR